MFDSRPRLRLDAIAPLLNAVDSAGCGDCLSVSLDHKIAELDGHLARMSLFQVNTGTREQEVAQLRWEWEIAILELETSVFVPPSAHGHEQLGMERGETMRSGAIPGILVEREGLEPSTPAL